MLIVLPSAPSSSSSIRYVASVGPWNESGGDVRLTKPSSSRPVISSPGRGRRDQRDLLGDRRPTRRSGSSSAEPHGPEMQLAPSEVAACARLHGALRIGCPAVVLLDGLDRVVGAGLLDRGVDLVEGQVRGLLTGGPEVARSPRERQRERRSSDRAMSLHLRPPPLSLSSSSPQAAIPNDKPATTRGTRTSLILDMNSPLSENTVGRRGPAVPFLSGSAAPPQR